MGRLRKSYFNVSKGRPQDVGRRHPLALHIGPYGDVHRTSFGDIFRTSSWHNFPSVWGNKTIFYLTHYTSLLKYLNFKTDHSYFSNFCLLKRVVLFKKQKIFEFLSPQIFTMKTNKWRKTILCLEKLINVNVKKCINPL